MSALQRSVIEVNPPSAEGTALREWWDSTGCCAPTQHAGEGLASARKCGLVSLIVWIRVQIHIAKGGLSILSNQCGNGASFEVSREWWDSTGCCAPTQHAGEGLASARKCAVLCLTVQISVSSWTGRSGVRAWGFEGAVGFQRLLHTACGRGPGLCP